MDLWTSPDVELDLFKKLGTEKDPGVELGLYLALVGY